MRHASVSKAPAVTKILSNLENVAILTDSDDAASDWADEHSPIIHASGSEAESASKQKNRVNSSASRLKAPTVKKVLKRGRADSVSSAAKSKKRVRTTALQRQAPIARNELPLDNGELA